MSASFDELYRIQKKDIPKSGAVLAEAFRHDPVWRKVFGTESTIDQKAAVFSTPVRYCLKFGEAYATSENLEGIIAWTPGGLADITIWRLIRSGGIRSGMKIGARIALQMESVFRLLRADREEHMKGAPFLYLQVLGVAQEFQGKGHGRRLLRALMENSERARVPVYLETETESNVRMYQKMGFRVLKEISLPEMNLPMWEMAREPG